ncbi:MAG TPA: hypothetical protein VGE98_11695, partial [Thermoanaerobaculia bacterium]
EVISIAPDGTIDSLGTWNEDTVYSLLWRGDRLWIGTGLEGKLYTYAAGQMLLEKDLDERQIVVLLPGDPGPTFVTTNGAALFRVTAGSESRGTYTSPALDAGQVARFGTFRWRGEAPAGASVSLSFRSGLSAEPDRTWSAWSTPPPRDGREVPLDAVPRGRFVQWRAELKAGSGGSPRLVGAELSYRQENVKPKITTFNALEPGQILVPQAFNPTSQVYEPAHPNRDGIFTTLESAPEDASGRTKPLWKKGFQTLRWTASDPNDDPLQYDLAFRPADMTGKEGWLKVADELKEDYFSFDATALPDGVYRFRLRASDRLANDPDRALTAERVSEPVVIDQTPPTLGKVERSDKTLRVTVSDAASPIREAVWSVDAGEWKAARPEDGLLDGRTETLLLDVPAEKGALLLLRVTDAAWNVITFDLSHHP